MIFHNYILSNAPLRSQYDPIHVSDPTPAKPVYHGNIDTMSIKPFISSMSIFTIETCTFLHKEFAEKYQSMFTAGSHYCCTAQDYLNGDQLTAQLEADLEKPA